jgi:hypothetical protein
MQTRSKVVELSGNRFQIRRLPPEVGSFIFLRMLGVRMRSMENVQAPQQKQEETVAAEAKKEEKITGEMQVRALSFSVLTGGIGFEDFKFIQTSCMKAAALIQERAEVDFPMPIVTDAGLWTAEGEVVASNVGLVMQLTTEVLIFCFADFFEGSGPGL